MPTEKRQRQDEGRLNRRVEMSIAAKRDQRKKQYRNIGIILAVLVVGAFLWSLNGAGDDEDPVDTAASSTSAPTDTTGPGGTVQVAYPGVGAAITGETPCPAADGSAERTTAFAAAPPTCIDAAKT